MHLHPNVCFSWGHQFCWIRAHPNDLILTWSPLQRSYLLIRSHPEVLGARTSAYLYWWDTIQSVAVCVCACACALETQEWDFWVMTMEMFSKVVVPILLALSNVPSAWWYPFSSSGLSHFLIYWVWNSISPPPHPWPCLHFCDHCGAEYFSGQWVLHVSPSVKGLLCSHAHFLWLAFSLLIYRRDSFLMRVSLKEGEEKEREKGS